MIPPAAPVVPVSTERPVPLVARRDLTIDEAEYQGVRYRIVKDPVALDYYRLDPEQYRILTWLDGRRSLEQIRREFQQEFPTRRARLADIQLLVADLHQKRLLVSNRPGQGPLLLQQRRERRRRQVLGAVRNVLYVRLPGWDPERVLAALYPWVRWVFHPCAVAGVVLLILASWLLLATHLGEFEQALPAFQQFFAWPNLLWLWLSIGLAKILHEFGHGLACRHYGGECHEIGLAFLVFSPCLYCDVSDSWVLPDTWKRILIASAGMYVEVAISALALFAWWHTQPGFVHHLCLNVFLVTAVTTVIFNANPLLRFDGYYILSDWLEIPNLQEKSRRLLQQLFGRVCLGLKLPSLPFMPERGQVWFALYAVAAALYRWFLVFAIACALFTLLKPYGLGHVGLAFGVFSGVMILAGLIAGTGRLILSVRNQRMSRLRAGLSLAAVAGGAAAVLFLPIPVQRELPLIVEPDGIRHVYISTPGAIEAIHVRPGQRVRRGDVLVVLSNFLRRDHHQRMLTARDVQLLEVSLQQALGDAAQEELARASLTTIEEQLRDDEQQLSRLVLRSPCDGLVVAPPERSAPAAAAAAAGAHSAASASRSLARWSGTPLDDHVLGAWLDSGVHVLSVAPEGPCRATLVVDQQDRHDLSVGQSLKIAFDHRPGEVRRTRVGHISDRHVESAPPALTRRFGGDLETAPGARGNQPLARAAYQATAILPSDAGPLLPGMRGRARMTVRTRTAGEWLWRAVCTTLRFRL
ncbi:MAG TPA: hypothetical protein VML55_08355 [Planctomycetaceae bacterium]|nr:hypothetical protein [Planctomycetaceae bacterium]